MSALPLLILYCVAVVLTSLLGGFIPHYIRLTHTRLQIALSFVAGAMLGVGLLHLVPHAYLLLGSIDKTMGCTLLGFLTIFFIERVFHFHHHGAPDETEAGEPEGHDHECAHGHHDHQHATDSHAHAHAHGGSPQKISWAAAMLGLTLHSLLDGVALAAAVSADIAEHGSVRWAGLAVFLVVVLHKPFDSLTLGTLMAVAGRSSSARHGANLLYAASVPVGALIFQLGLMGDPQGNTTWIGAVLALSAGTFLCISTSDLLPELQFHTHDRFRLSAALLLGLALSWSIVFLEEHGHDHQVPHGHPPGHEH